MGAVSLLLVLLSDVSIFLATVQQFIGENGYLFDNGWRTG